MRPARASCSRGTTEEPPEYGMRGRPSRRTRVTGDTRGDVTPFGEGGEDPCRRGIRRVERDQFVRGRRRAGGVGQLEDTCQGDPSRAQRAHAPVVGRDARRPGARRGRRRRARPRRRRASGQLGRQRRPPERGHRPLHRQHGRAGASSTSRRPRRGGGPPATSRSRRPARSTKSERLAGAQLGGEERRDCSAASIGRGVAAHDPFGALARRRRARGRRRRWPSSAGASTRTARAAPTASASRSAASAAGPDRPTRR